ncbi:MAG: type II restriction endonuclease [Ginsengibacter sp.]
MSKPISSYFSGIAAKRLTEVEITETSNQHEFNGIAQLKEIFGSDKIRFDGKFILFNDEEDKMVQAEGALTWYDARGNHATRTEYRLYYTENTVIENAAVGDLVIIGRTGKSSLAIIVAPANTTSEKQLLWLFGLAEVENRFIVKDLTKEKTELGFAGNYIISALGFDTEQTEEDFLDMVLDKFGNTFPSTAAFSNFTRSTFKDISPTDDPDRAILAYMQRELELFKALEKHIVEEKLKQGFGNNGTDVDDFIQFSLSVQNRRKSRAGFAFENHLAFIFNSYRLSFSTQNKTERNNKPDFLFPGIIEYRDPNFQNSLLTMLGVKTTAKDRWRQVLSEADRIWPKHLITLEPAISTNQTDEMLTQRIQLVLPKELISTYTKEQQENILNLNDFISIVIRKENLRN